MIELDRLKFRQTHDGRWMQGSTHTVEILNHKRRKQIVEKICNKLSSINFDTIVCSGISGLLVVPSVSERLNKNILIVRKDNEIKYSPFDYEGTPPSNYIIVDDLVSSGQTIQRILSLMREEIPSAKCVGFYSYLKDQCFYAEYRNEFQKTFQVPYI